MFISHMFFIFFFTKLALVTGHPVKIPSHPKKYFFEMSFNELFIFLFRGARIPFSAVATMYAYFFNFFVATTLWASYLTLAGDSPLFLFFSLPLPLIFTIEKHKEAPHFSDGEELCFFVCLKGLSVIFSVARKEHPHGKK